MCIRDSMLIERQHVAPRRIKINEGYFLNILLFADDLGLIAPTEGDIQKQSFYLDKVITEYGGSISLEKAKAMAHWGTKRRHKQKWVYEISPCGKFFTFSVLPVISCINIIKITAAKLKV